ncbi:hypothetical protein SAMN05443247_06012 [Bradyrhizobium erythrophlei]|nr:hypothetical protein SAMN05443247_06012 [Bradyrhizobium erythrophlei]
MHNALTEVLDGFGTEIAPGGFATFSDFAKAENADIHHSAVPAAVTAFATISPAFARGRFPDLSLADVVLKRNDMDYCEAAALAAVCGQRISPWRDAAQFIVHLHKVIDRYDLNSFYGHYPEHPANFGNDIRPHGVDWDSHEVNDDAIRVWRDAYKRLSPARQMIVATIMWLYVGSNNCFWLKHLPNKWHAADAIKLMKSAGVLGDWATLVALYPGW